MITATVNKPLQLSDLLTEESSLEENYYARLPLIRELFSDVWGQANPPIRWKEEKNCVRESENALLAFNGGDYSYYSHKIDKFEFESNSSDFGSGDGDWVGGYFCGIPIILRGINGENNPYDILFENGGCVTIAPCEAWSLQKQMVIVCSSGGRIDFCL